MRSWPTFASALEEASKMSDSVTDWSNTVGFVDLDDYDAECVTQMSIPLLEDALSAARALDAGGSHVADIALIGQDGLDNPAMALVTDNSDPTAVMIAARQPVGGDDDH